MRQIKFIHTGHSNALGNFSDGDTARVSDAEAAHYVSEAMCAVYVDAAAPEVVAVEAKPAKAKKGQK